MKSFVEKDLSTIVQISGVYVKQVLATAEKTEAEVNIDINFIEDTKARAEIVNLEGKKLEL